MQIYNNPQVPPVVTSPNFKAIKSVKCEGLYKEFPRYGKDLPETWLKEDLDKSINDLIERSK